MLVATTAHITNADIVDERALSDLTPAATSPVFCVADLNGVNQTGVASATNTKVNLSHAPINVGGGFDTANKWFKPTIAGYYSISAQISATMPANTVIGLQIRVNGGIVAFVNTVAPVASLVFATTQQIVYLNGGSDYVEMWGSQNSGSPGTFDGNNTRTFLTANRIA